MGLRIFFLLLAVSISAAQAKRRPKAPSAAATEAQNEAEAPSFSAQVREARFLAAFLADALVLTHAQQHAVEAHTLTERKALALAATAADAAAARQQYQAAVRRVLATSQMQAYTALRQRLADTVLPLDGTEIAAR